ncbi:hypothetical protein MSAN_00082900 [Mycena sanguinolenta]|uniref:F-box domain-containing protein n=1 Tax=Mycena sanguinolenta TaxID=230812 RepID=A0A8H7DMJ0_9AGAR|nr:hypothetical protein MSAN_00082900 [Mycena sanguinolenta]
MSATEAPVILGRICSAWRAISLSAPRLWSRVHISEPTRPFLAPPYAFPPGLYEAKIMQLVDVAVAWLRRSGTCPLSISLECGLDHDRDHIPSFTPLSTPNFFDVILVPFASRWETISLKIPPVAVQALLRLTESDVPLLKSLTIVERPVNHGDHPEWEVPQGSVLQAPRLSKFSLAGADVLSSALPLRWGSLTALILMGTPWSGENDQTCQVVLEIFSKCSQLQTCVLCIHEPPDGGLQDSSGSPIECSFLHTLDMMCFSSPLDTFGRLLSRLAAPDLRDLKLRGAENMESTLNAESLVSALLNFVRLESITIDSTIFSSPYLIDFLGGLSPTVQHLHIKESWQPPFYQPSLEDDVFIALEGSDLDHPVILPALGELTITGCRKVSDEVLLRFIVSRMPTLRHIDIQFDREMQVDILPSLQAFLEAGVEISVNYITIPSLRFSPWMGLAEGPSLDSDSEPWIPSL